MRACTHGGLAHRLRVSTTFLTEKLSPFFSCAPDAGGDRTFDPLDLWISNPTLYQLSHPVVHVGVRWITELEKIQHVLLGLGSAILVAAVALPSQV